MLSFKKYRLLLRFHYSFLLVVLAQSSTPDVINLAGTWHVKLDRTDVGEQEQWFNKFLNGTITLPGSLTTNNIGDDVSLSTPWTGDIIDSSFFTKPQYAKYRTAETLKFRFGCSQQNIIKAQPGIRRK